MNNKGLPFCLIAIQSFDYEVYIDMEASKKKGFLDDDQPAHFFMKYIFVMIAENLFIVFQL